MKLAPLALAAAVAALAPAAATAQDAAAGQKVFNRCRACHVVDQEQNRVGPHLVGVIGRDVAAVDGYNYSSAMTEWGEGKVWDDATMAEYLADPRGVVKGTKMAFAGLKKEQEIKDVIAYLENPGS
ncbi:MAG: c-type cytochrome [Paracoccaceae bacterium]